MSRVLGVGDIAPAVLGGTILGGGGGGHAADGVAMGHQAVSAGEINLVSPDELPADAIVAICAGVGAPGAPDKYLAPDHFLVALEHLSAEISRRGLGEVAAVATNENGAMGTVNGWLQAAKSGLPLLDCPCNGRAHPTAVMGSLGLHRDSSYTSVAGYAGGSTSYYVEGVVAGSLAQTSKAVRELSVVAGGLVAVARNPVTVEFLVANGAPGAVSQAIAVGEAHSSGGIEAVANLLGGEIVASGEVSDFVIRQSGGFDVGSLTVDGLDLTFVNEYMSAVRGGTRLASFPDLLMTFRDGDPIVSADLADGMDLQVLAVPRTGLKLSMTMSMPELMEPISALLDESRR